MTPPTTLNHFGMLVLSSNNLVADGWKNQGQLLTTMPIEHGPTRQVHGHHYHATVLTEVNSVQNHHVHSAISVINVNKVIQGSNAAMSPAHLSGLKHSNSLPNGIISFVNIKNIYSLLLDFPDRNIADYVVEGLTNGFDIGFRGIGSECRPKHLLSATQYRKRIKLAIEKELERGHTSGPFRNPPFEGLHCSPIGGVLKKDNSCRLIMDLSQPRGESINECIPKEDFTVRYSQFDEATDLVRQAGIQCYLSKVDIKHAFRLLPVKPSNWHLLGYLWDGHYFIDTRLAFGLRSSPSIFNRFADLICWILKNKYDLYYLVHYADDFFLVSDIHLRNAKVELKE